MERYAQWKHIFVSHRAKSLIHSRITKEAVSKRMREAYEAWKQLELEKWLVEISCNENKMERTQRTQLAWFSFSFNQLNKTYFFIFIISSRLRQQMQWVFVYESRLERENIYVLK